MGADPVPLWSAYIQITCMGKPQVGTPVNHSPGNCCCRSSIFFQAGQWEQKSEVPSFSCWIVISPQGSGRFFKTRCMISSIQIFDMRVTPSRGFEQIFLLPRIFEIKGKRLYMYRWLR